jgi:hypothetical protein
VLSSAVSLWKSFRAQAERDSGIGLKLFGFIAESVFTFIPESCSGSSRNAVRNHPGIAFTFLRIPQRWGICRDLEAADRYIETFVVSSWSEHLRQHDCFTRADSQLEERLRGCFLSEPNVRHLLYL